MSTRQKSGKHLYKKLFFFSLALHVISGVLYFSKYKNDKEILERLEQKIKTQNDEVKILNKIFSAESKWLSGGELSQTVEALEELNEEYASSKIKKRIGALQRMQEELTTDTLSPQQNKDKIRNINKSIVQLKNKNDSLNNVVDRKFRQLNNKNDSLKNLLQKKQKKLDRKESIQVITFKSSKGDEVHYLGEVEHGKANGGGVGIWRTGSIYRGQWKNNQRQGEGVFEWADGQKYKGDFKNDLITGKGTYYWPSGERYEGEFRDGRREGQGTLYDPDGNVIFEGKWEDDEPVVE